MNFTTANLTTTFLVPVLLSALLLTGCDKGADATKAAADAAMQATDAAKDAMPEATPGAAPAATEAAPAAESTAGGGGYEPTAEERIPGETRAVDVAPAN